MATDDDWCSYDRAVVDFSPEGAPPFRLVPDRVGATGTWPDGLHPPVVVVTAWNPDSRPVPEDQNRDRHRRLVSELDRQGLAHFSATGRDPITSHHEFGVAVAGLDEAGAIALGRHHGQAAVYLWTPDAWLIVSCTDDRRHIHLRRPGAVGPMQFGIFNFQRFKNHHDRRGDRKCGRGLA